MCRLNVVLLLVCVTTGGLSLPARLSADNSTVDFPQQIKPILQKYCVSCHGPDQAESGLRLDFGVLLVRGGDRGAAVVPGKSADSLLYKVLIGEGEVAQMPEGQPPLDKKQIELIQQWIDQGAKGSVEDTPSADGRPESDHWAFQPVQRPKLPAVSQPEWVQNEIDRFVLARLDAEKLVASVEADRSTLIRRLSLDLLGVLPTPEEVAGFQADTEAGAYGRLVDRMLASPRYGERWGRHWLDIARYADSNGFTIDGPRSIWPYRDWVIRSINENKPFDQFVIEQLAGDLLSDATREQIIATGFHRNTLINQEGGTDKEQFRVESIVDRINTTGAAFLGITIGCAQCHVHKYDPFTQREYYQLFALFNNCDEPNYPLPSDEQAAAQTRVKKELAELDRQLKEHDAARAAGQSDWEKLQLELPVANWTPLKPTDAVSEAGATLNMIDESSILVGGNGNVPAQDVFTVKAGLPEGVSGPVTAVRLEALENPLLPMKGPGWADNGNFVLSEFELTVSDGQTGDNAAQPQKAEFAQALTDWQQDGYGVDLAADGDLKTGWAINGTKKSSPNVSREAIFVLKQPLELAEGSTLTFNLRHAQNSKYLIGSFRLSVTDANLPDSEGPRVVPTRIREILAVETDKRDDGQKEHLTAAYGRSDVSRKPLEARQTKLKAEESSLAQAIPTTMILRERTKNPRQTHIMIRGNFLELGARVEPGVPAILPPLPATESPANRLDFARWLFDPRHPLTSRVTVNRFWQRFFGLGLVETENDFGTQGAPPSHPQLLDWLASEFMRLNWDVKALHRTIVMSATYRQSSAMRPELLERDPRNRLLARQSRVRLEAEGVRDAALSASGLISQKMLGPGVYPPQPQGIYVVTQVAKQWPESKGDDRYRRALYTYFWRSSPYPMLPTFDAPDANGTCTRRNRSNTPLQALTLANDASFMEFARGLSDRLLVAGAMSDADRIRLAFQAALSREASTAELERLSPFVTSQRSYYELNEEAATAVASATRPAETSAAESATWTVFARILLNLDEFITRE
jgi:mono/diheme cytochrome c family protein